MNTETLLARAREAALTAGARQVDCFHRSSTSRILILEPGCSQWQQRREEGVAVRAWTRDGPAGMAAMSIGEDPEELGRRAAAMAGARPQRAGTAQPATAEEDEQIEESEPAAAMMAPAALELFDPEFLRASRGDLERRLEDLSSATGIARRSGVKGSTRAILRLATMDRHLLTQEGIWQAQRSTLASLSLRFPSAFGLSSVEIASRRLADLSTAPLVPWLAAHPAPVARMARFRAEPATVDGQGGEGDTVLTLAPPVVAALLTSVAARAAAGGRRLGWAAPATLRDDPTIPWGPGTTPLDGEGSPAQQAVLAAGADAPSGQAVRLNPLRLSYREPPQPLPSNLILEGLPPGGAAAAGARFHLLDLVARHGGRLLVRAVDKSGEGSERPVLMEIPARLERFLSAEATAGPAQPFLVGEAFVSCPAVTIPGWRVLQAG